MEVRQCHELAHVLFAFLIEQSGHQPVLREIERRTGGVKVHGRILRIAIVREMAAGAIQLEPADVRGVNRLVAALDQLLSDECLQDAANGSSFWHPQDEA